MSQATTTLLGALLGGIVGMLVAYFGYRQKEREMFYRALDWLSGGTQRRSLGIAAIESLWTYPSFRSRLSRSRPATPSSRFVDLSIPVLANSAVYLLLAKDQRLKAHELKNLERIMRLLTETQLTPDQRARHAFHYSSVRDALDETSRRLAEPSGGKAARDDAVEELEEPTRAVKAAADDLEKQLRTMKTKPTPYELTTLRTHIDDWLSRIDRLRVGDS
jgi:hypothetical protein